MSKKLIIHIGAHKTGSTAIQKLLYENVTFFEERFQISYPIEELTDKNKMLFGQHLIPWSYLDNYFSYLDNYFRNANTVREIFLKSIKKDCPSVLFSSENFILFKEEHIANFFNEIKEFFDDIIIICYVRNQVQSSIALYQTDVISRRSEQIFLQWLDNRRQIFDYYSIVKQWENAGCKVIVRPFDRKWFKDEDLILDFLNILSRITDQEITPPPEYSPEKYRVNETLPGFITEMVQYYNTRPTKNKVVPVLRELGFKLIKVLPDLPRYDLIPPSSRKQILEYYRESNSKLCREYLGLDADTWFNENITETDEEWKKEHFGEGSQIVRLAKAVLRLIENLEEKKIYEQ